MQFELLSSINFEKGNIFLNYTPSDTIKKLRLPYIG